MINCQSVIDLSSVDCETVSARFYVDTNIWYKMTNVNANPKDIDIKYTELISKLVNNTNVTLYRSKLSYTEIANCVDRDAFDEFKKRDKSKFGNLSRKEFRHMSKQRAGVVDQIISSIKQLESFTNDVADDDYDEVLNYVTESSFEVMIKETLLDPTDMFMVDFMRQNGVSNIITDDGDYLTAKGINVFTLNQHSIRVAKKENKLKQFTS